MIDTLFIEIGAVILTAGVLSLVARLFRQPLIIAYIITGLIVGPGVLGLTESAEVFKALAEIGIAFLLFLVGLNLNWRSVKDVGMIAFFAGLGQIIFTTGIGIFVGQAFGFDLMTSLFIATAFAFSSTIIIVKLLSDKEDIERFYGRVSIGVLIVQDLVAMMLLLVVGSLRAQEGALEVVLLMSAAKLIAVVFILWLLAKYVLPKLFAFVASSHELLFMTSLSWCFAVASGLHFLGFGIEIGALLAGISLAGLAFHREVEAKVRPLRDFFLILFFIYLGTTLSLSSVAASLPMGIAFSAFILIGNPIILLIILRAFGYHPRTGFLVGVTMAQISEFSFIFLAAGVTAGFVDSSILPLTTIVALITIAISTYMINYNEAIYDKMEFLFYPLELAGKEKRTKVEHAPEVIMFGYHRLGERILPAVKSLKKDYLVVDIDPKAIEQLKQKRIPHMYGDAGNQDLLQAVQAHKAKIIISTIPDDAVSADIIEFLKGVKRTKATIIVTVKSADRAKEMYELGAHFVIVPTILGGEHFAELLKRRKDKKMVWTSAAKSQKKSFGF